MGYIALYGGSFNPVHNGHLKTAVGLCNEFGLDQILFMPNASPPHKDTVKLAYEDRMDMLKAALEECQDKRLAISRAEEDSSIAHYTYETLTALKAQHPNDRFAFIMGMDSLLALHTWRRGLEIIELADIIVLDRPGYDINTMRDDTKECIAKHRATAPDATKHAPAATKHAPASAGKAGTDYDASAAVEQCPCGHHYYFAHNQNFDVSSTQLRNLIASSPQKPAQELYELLPAAVIDIIYSRHFYGAGA